MKIIYEIWHGDFCCKNFIIKRKINSLNRSKMEHNFSPLNLFFFLYFIDRFEMKNILSHSFGSFFFFVVLSITLISNITFGFDVNFFNMTWYCNFIFIVKEIKLMYIEHKIVILIKKNRKEPGIIFKTRGMSCIII